MHEIFYRQGRRPSSVHTLSVLEVNISDSEPDRNSSQNIEPARNSEDLSNADVLSLFKTYMNEKLDGIERNFDDKTHSLAKKVKKVESTFKFKGNQIQFELNADIIDNIDRAVVYFEKKKPQRGFALLEDSVTSLKKRNKLIRIADKSEGGWNTVQEYLSDDVASNSEDEKRIRAAETRAVRKIKSSKAEKKQPRTRPDRSCWSTRTSYTQWQQCYYYCFYSTALSEQPGPSLLFIRVLWILGQKLPS